MADPIPLPELPDGSVAGPNLELDAAFGALERAAQGKPETQYGNTIEPATPADWKETATLAEALLARTRDLRVMALLSIARLHLYGITGFSDGLAIIRQHLATAWDDVHPQLDPEDDNDPMQRANAVLILQDPARVLRPMRDTALATTPRTGPVSWRDIAVANGTQEPEPGRERMGEAAIRAAFAGTDAGRLAALHRAVETGLADLVAIPAAFDEKSTSGSGPDFKDLIKLLRDIQKELKRYETLAAESAEPEDEADAGGPEAEASAAPQRRAGAAAIQSIAAVASRDDALHALQLAAAYFRTNEPSSPLPLLIERAIRLAPLPFMEILRDLAPDGLMQAQTIAGTSNE